MLKAFLRVILTLFFLCAAAEAAQFRDVSMIQLIANPEQYDAKPIRLIAFLNVEFEGDALYLHREDFERGMLANAVAISLTDRQARVARHLNRGYVIVEGVFSAKERGHMGTFSGSIGQLTRIGRWTRRRR